MVALVDRLDLDAAHPLVVVVDDAHWADPASLRALGFAARRLRRDPVALVLTARTVSLPQLPDGLRRLVDDDGATVRLGPLSRDDVRVLAADRMGAFAPPGGQSGTFAELDPGDYAMICFIPVGGEDGPPHFTEGMLQEVTVE